MKKTMSKKILSPLRRDGYKAGMIMMLIALSTMLLTTACSSEDDVITNNENINKKGYEIPVTLNATRQGDATTRATYNPDTRMLEYSTGDQLYVLGNHSTAGMFYGTLEWKGGIIFSGTITTTNQYSGSGVELLSSSKWARAILLPAGYNNYHYITINNPGFSGHPYAAFATSKATAIEQFSNESASGYNNGFELLPQNAILNFTITGLTPNTEFAVELWNSYYSLVEGNVTTNGSGTATFAIGIDISMCKAPATTVDIDDLYNKGWDLRIKDNNNDYVLRMLDDNNPLVTSSKPLVAGKIYNITRSAAPAPAPEEDFVTFSDGTNTVKVATKNLGATTVAESAATSYGDYYAWGATETFGTVSYTAYNAGTVTATTGHEGGYTQANAPYYSVSAYTYTKYTSSSDATLVAADDAVAANMPGYHMPTRAELQTLFNACGGTGEIMSPSSISNDAAYAKGIYWVAGATSAVTIGGDTYSVNGVLFVQDADTHVFFPAAGKVDGTVLDAGSGGYYWSSSLFTDYTKEAYYLNFFSFVVNPGGDYDRYCGFPVRPFKD